MDVPQPIVDRIRLSELVSDPLPELVGNQLRREVLYQKLAAAGVGIARTGARVSANSSTSLN